MTGPRFLLDTNVLIRFLLHDDPKQSRQVDTLFSQADQGKCTLILTDIAMAEAVWVLTSVYEISRKQVAEALGTLITKAGVKCSNIESLIDALARFKSTNCDFMDCHLAALAAASGDGVASFDCDLRKFKDIKLWKFDEME